MLIECVLFSSRRQFEIPRQFCVGDLIKFIFKDQTFQDSTFYVICNGKKLANDTLLEEKTYHFVPRLVGGKGGFGSMLRAIGAQIEKTTSREACRDLSGRRMRDINNEKKLKEWLSKEAEREQEREERKKDRLAKHLRPQHKFDDEDYHEQKAKVQEDLQDALNTGLKRKMKTGGDSSSQDKKLKTIGKPSKTEWLGVDLDSDDLCSSDSDMEANPGDSNPSSSAEGISGASNRPGLSCEDSKAKEQITSSIVTESNSEPPLVSKSCKIPDSQGPLVSHPKPTNQPQNIATTDINLQNKMGSVDNDIPVDTPVNLDEFNSNVDLEALGLERLKNALIARGLKCGGTLEERAIRLMTVKGLSPEEIHVSYPNLLAKSGGKGGKVKKSK